MRTEPRTSNQALENSGHYQTKNKDKVRRLRAAAKRVSAATDRKEKLMCGRSEHHANECDEESRRTRNRGAVARESSEERSKASSRPQSKALCFSDHRADG